METLTYDITSLPQLALAVEELLVRAVNQSDGSGAVVIALSGDLGAGKTTLVQTLARRLGVTDTVTSPTFVVMKQYETTDGSFTSLIHIDAYRIEDVDEMRPLGFTSLLAEPGTLVCIEWAERIGDLLPLHTIATTLMVDPSGKRTLTIHST